MTATIKRNQQEKIALRGQTGLTTNFSLHDLRIAYYGGLVSQRDAIRAFLQSQLGNTTTQSLNDLWRLYFIFKGVTNQVSLVDMAKDFFTNVGFGSTASAPTVTDSAATGITATQATGNGNVTSDGGASVTERGFVWGASANPTTASNIGKQTAAGTTGAFTATMGSLSAVTTYHYRAYAINSQGTSYGADQTFTTNAVTVVNESMATTPSTGIITDNASWDAGGFLILVSNSTSQHGEFEYIDSGQLGSNFTNTFDFKVHPNAGSGGDALWFYFGSSSTPGDEDGNSGGYSINIDDYSGDFSTLQLNFQGGRLHDDNTIAASVIADGNWHTAKIVVALPNIQVWLDGTKYIDFTDSTRVLGGNKFGWGARCGGGSSNEHDVRNLLITKP